MPQKKIKKKIKEKQRKIKPEKQVLNLEATKSQEVSCPGWRVR